MLFAIVPLAASALVPPSVQPPTVATPEALVVGVVGKVRLPPPAVTPKVTVTPDTALLNASRTNADGAVPTVIPTRAVWLFPPLTTIDAAPAAFTVTEAVCVITPAPVTVACMVFACARVELNVEVNTPLTLVVPFVGLNVQLEPTEQDGVTVAPLMALPNGSFTVAVNSDAVPPPVVQETLHAVIELLLAVKVDTVRLTLEAFTVTAAVCVRVPDPVTVALIVFAWAAVEENVA